MAYLVGKTEAGEAFRISLPESGEAVLGRAPDRADRVIDDGSVSGRHCSILRTDEGWVVKDLGSTNGTRVNGEAISEAPLAPGDTLMLGDRQLILEDHVSDEGGKNATDTGSADASEDAELESPGMKISPRTLQVPTVKVLPAQFKKRPPHTRRWLAIIVVFVVIAVLLAVRYAMTLR